MGITERKEREKLERANSILDAAENVFRSKGIDSATVSDVAEQAELAKGTLYLYFKSKDDLCMGINARGIAILNEMFLQAIAPHELGRDKVRAIGEAYMEFSSKYPLYSEIMVKYDDVEVDFMDLTESQQLCLARADESMGVFVEAIANGVKDGSIRKDIDPLKTALLLWSFSFGLVQLLNSKAEMLKEHFETSREDIMEYFYSFIEKTLKP